MKKGALAVLSILFAIAMVSLCNASISRDDWVKAEQEYEKEHDCVIIDAAITYNDIVYIFNDDQYLTLDEEGKEISIHNISKWGGLSPNIDAGVVWPKTDATYFFKGGQYYRYFTFMDGITLGPLNNSHLDPIFDKGIDAAANHKGNSYFFQGCKLLGFEDGSAYLKQFPHIPGCLVDAAFTKNDTLHAIVGDHVYRIDWGINSDRTPEPKPLTSVVKMTSWKACKVATPLVS